MYDIDARQMHAVSCPPAKSLLEGGGKMAEPPGRQANALEGEWGACAHSHFWARKSKSSATACILRVYYSLSLSLPSSWPSSA